MKTSSHQRSPKQQSPARGLQRLTSYFLALLLVYQLGVCPCGCLEHNAWFEWLGLDADAHQHAEVADDQPSLSCAEGHDCVGKPRPLYVSQSHDLKGQILAISATKAALGQPDAFDPVDLVVRAQDRGPPDFSAQPLRASLQVFLL